MYGDSPAKRGMKSVPRRFSELRTELVTRRDFIRWLLGAFFLTLSPFRIPQSLGAGSIRLHEEGRDSIAEFFRGEELSYEFGVWVFRRAALGRLTFRESETKGRYVATLEGESQGFLGWVARHRVDTYRAVMEEVDGGRRLKALSFEENVRVGDELRRRMHLFDYEKRRWTQMRRRKNGTMEVYEEEIPPGLVYDDFLTASYNFRYGVYGKIERGRDYLVGTFPKKGSSRYEVKIAAKREEEERRRSERFKEGKDFFVKLLLDPELTHSKEGRIEGWLSKEFYPVAGAIKDVAFFGDVKGTLIKKVRS